MFRRRSAMDQFGGLSERHQQAALVGFSGARNVESGAMIDGSTDLHDDLWPDAGGVTHGDSDGGQRKVVHKILRSS